MSLTCPAFVAAIDPALCRLINHYCERTSPALDSEPLNAISNVAFLVASAAAWRLSSRHAPARDGGLIRTLIALIAIIGLSSFLFHTLGTRWAEWADVLPILLFIVLYLWLILTLFFGWSLWLKLAAVLLLSAVTLFLEAFAPAKLLSGGALYLPTAFTLIAVSISLWRIDRATGRNLVVASAVFCLSFAARTLDMPLCDGWPLGTHFLWHLLNSTLLYLLVRATILHRPQVMQKRCCGDHVIVTASGKGQE